ncbi:MAG: Inner membrane protein YbjJ [Desulfovibrio sp.]
MFHPEGQNNGETIQGGKRATRLSFFIAGFGLACWAPLIPFAQSRMDADAATLGTILLCLGLGAVIGMPAAGALSSRVGAKLVIACGAAGLILSIPLLAVLSSPAFLGICLLVFGGSIGAIDVAANIHGTEVQNAAAMPLMSGFHGLYSIGGLAGASGMTAAVAAGLHIVVAAGLASAVILACIVLAVPGFMPTRATESQPMFAVPKGPVLVIGVLALIIFLAEGAMLDWSALLLTQVKKVDVTVSGAGYAVFSLTMVISRFVGDRIVYHAGERAILLGGMALTAAGIALAAFAQPFLVILMGMALAGFAAGNIVPVLFTLAGRQRVMPASHAIAATSILGYTGVLLGPALIGYLANFTGLCAAFYALAVLLLAALPAIPGISPPKTHGA